MKVPKIRFPGFTEPWEQRKLENLVQFSKGTGYSKGDLKAAGTPIILYGRLYTKYETVISDVDTFADAKTGSVYSRGGEVIVPASGETAEDISIASVVEKSGVLLGGDLNIITPPEHLDSAFLAISISNGKTHEDMAKMAQGKSVVHLHNTDLEKIDLLFPSLSEQVQISSFFGRLDSLISLHQRKLEQVQQLKSAMLQKMFPKDGKDEPEIRFSGFDEPWKQCSLHDIAVRVTRKNKNLESELPLTISAQYGLIDQNEFFDKRVASKDVSGYYLMKKGEYAYNKSTSNDAPWGAIKRLERYDMGVVSTLYIVFALKEDGNIDSDFFSAYYDTDLWHKGIKDIAAEGARTHGLLNIAPSAFFDTTLAVPQDIEEQRQIGQFFMNLNNTITLHQQRLDTLKKLKKGFLQKMFV